MTIPNRQLVATKPPTEKPENNKQFGFCQKSRKYIYIWPDMWIIAVPKKIVTQYDSFWDHRIPSKRSSYEENMPPWNPSPPPIETSYPPVLTPKWGLKTGGCFDTPNPTSQGFLGPGFFSAYRFCPTSYQPKKPEVFHGVFLPIGSMGRLYIYLT